MMRYNSMYWDVVVHVPRKIQKYPEKPMETVWEICIRKLFPPMFSLLSGGILWGMLVLNIFRSDFKLKMLSLFASL